MSQAPAPVKPRAATPSAASDVGRTLGNYQLQNLLGKGGMGAVYRGLDTALQRPVAIKFLAAHFAGQKELVERFLREARLVAKLNHENICDIYHLGIDPRTKAPWFAMELVEGKSLEDLLKEEGQLAPERALPLVRQTAVALKVAMAKDIIHRDIKPANIMVQADGVAKVTDFGLGKLVEGGTDLTQANVIMGTPDYMSPEACEGGQCDFRTDIYALGVTYFQLLTGRPPFEGPSAMSILQKHMSVAVPKIRSIRKDVDGAVGEVIEKMMAKDREQRYCSYDDLLADLDALAKGKRPEVAGAFRHSAKLKEVSSQLMVSAGEGAVKAADVLAPKIDVKRNIKLKLGLGTAVLLLSWLFFWGKSGMIRIPSGVYRVGEPGELVEVKLGAFYIDRYEVTNGEFHKALKLPPPPSELRDLPKILKNKEDLKTYLAARGVKLPTEEQWQVAARGSQALPYPWGDIATEDHLKGRVNVRLGSKIGTLVPVGSSSLDRSPLGCFDMAGNAQEIVRCVRPMEEGAEAPEYQILGASFEDRLGEDSCAWESNTDYLREPYLGRDVGFRAVHEVGLMTWLGEWGKRGATGVVVVLLFLFL
jgi:predicted Ser/Thr protein kinase